MIDCTNLGRKRFPERKLSDEVCRCWDPRKRLDTCLFCFWAWGWSEPNFSTAWIVASSKSFATFPLWRTSVVGLLWKPAWAIWQRVGLDCLWLTDSSKSCSFNISWAVISDSWTKWLSSNKSTTLLSPLSVVDLKSPAVTKATIAEK